MKPVLTEEEAREIEDRMDEPPFLIPVLFDHAGFLQVQVDSGCDCYGAISERAAQRLGLERVRLPTPRVLGTAAGQLKNRRITHLARSRLDIDGWKCPALLYVVPGLARDAILGVPWMRMRDVSLHAGRGELVIGEAEGLVVKELHSRPDIGSVVKIMGCVFAGLVRRGKKRKEHGGSFMATSIHEINTILDATAEKAKDPPGAARTALLKRLPKQVRDLADLFDKEKADGLPPHRGTLDHHIRLRKDEDGRAPELPWGPLYSMSRDHLLELRRQIMALMDKGWIRASSSSAAAPVLLVKKPGGGWRFCVDYRALNKLTDQDRYPLPLIKETLRSLAGARWFTKLDVRSAFHRIRIAEGDEKLTAFRTRFGLFEWLVCPFGLSGAPATFQRYINKALDGPLGDFVTAYLDDVLIYSGGSYADHMKKVRVVLERLKAAGLNIDIDKCAFAVKEVKYLGFIVEASVGIRPDPEKVAAIREWEPPTRVRGVRSFLGFANFYRDFVKDFSEIADPLIRLTKKGAPFRWGEEEDKAFETLKAVFISYPVLAEWDPNRDTLVEADSSGRALGGCLSQHDKNGILHPVAYHSARLTPAQRNYTIHDKELLAVVSCLKAWMAELKSVARPFTVLTDHKNLEYFTRPRLISERQARWAETLSHFRFILRYRPGSEALRPDALSRKDRAAGGDEAQTVSVMRPVSICATETTGASACALPSGKDVFLGDFFSAMWDQGVAEDKAYRARLDAVREGARRFPKEAGTREQTADCKVNHHGALLYRGRLWLPQWEPLTTAVIQQVHESSMAGHPGRNTTFQLLQRNYHWDGMSQAVRRFVRNCHCYGGHVSRQRRQGLLRPLPIADRFWTQISVDFMTDLPATTEDDPRYLMVITDRLSKYIQVEAMTSMTAEACAERFKECWWRFHGFPKQIISDRGSDWVGDFWTALCGLVGTEQLLSTAYHPQTDGGTERANQEVQAVLRVMVNFTQTDWPSHLAACQLALNNRNSTVTGVSPNRLLNGFDIDLIQHKEHPKASKSSPKGRASAFFAHLQEGTAIAQAAIAYTQQRQMESTNRSRRPAERFQVGDRVWLSLRNIKTSRPSKKLDWIYAKYTVMATPNPLTVTLDVPGGIHPTFHVDLVERAANDPLTSQVLVDRRPDPEWITQPDGEAPEAEYHVEEILAAKNARGRGKRQVLVKWEGYLQPTWEPLERFQDTRALDTFEQKWGDARLNNGPRTRRRGE